MIIPFLKNYVGLYGFWLWFACSVWATCELNFWYLCAGQVLRLTLKNPKVQEAFHEGKELGQEVRDELKEAGLMDKITVFVMTYLNPHKHKSKEIVLLAKSGSYLSIFLLGAFFPFFVGVFICRTTKWRSGFVVMIMGNILKITLAIAGWHFIPPHWGKWVILGYCSLVLIGTIYSKTRKKNPRK